MLQRAADATLSADVTEMWIKALLFLSPCSHPTGWNLDLEHGEGRRWRTALAWASTFRCGCLHFNTFLESTCDKVKRLIRATKIVPFKDLAETPEMGESSRKSTITTILGFGCPDRSFFPVEGKWKPKFATKLLSIIKNLNYNGKKCLKAMQLSSDSPIACLQSSWVSLSVDVHQIHRSDFGTGSSCGFLSLLNPHQLPLNLI